MSRNAKIIYWWTLAAIMVPNVILCFTEHFTLLQSATNIFLPLGAIWLLMSLTRRVGASVWGLFVLIFLAAFQIVLLSLYGRSVIAVDMYLNVVTTNSSEAGELLKGMVPALIAVCVLYLPPLVMSVIALLRNQMISESMLRNCRSAARLTLGMGIILFGLCLVSAKPYNPLRQLYPLNAAYNLYLAIQRTNAQAHYPASAEGFAFGARPADNEPGITLIVIGETSRASSWQLFGYGRPTTPRLSSRDDVVAFPRALSQSNTTHKSVPLMLSHLRADQFGDSIYHVKGIITAFREAGCPTAFISNQDRNGALIDCFGEEADTCIFLADRLDHNRSDLSLLPVVGEIIDSMPRDRKSLIVVHTYGSHYNYNDRYPADLARFKPDGPLEAEPSYRPTLINAYDNSIMLTDYLLSAMMQSIERAGISGSIVYTSDHGEDIYDDSRHLFLHASPIPTYEQLHVPMLVWMSPAYRASHPERYLAAMANSRRPVATSASVFPTAMQLAGIASPRSERRFSLVSNDYTPAPYTYLDDHNEALTPAAAELDRSDIGRIDSLYTRYLSSAALMAVIGPCK